VSKEPKLHKSQQQRLDNIVQKHLDYIDEVYDKGKPKKKEPRKASDIGLPDKPKKKPKKPNYGLGRCVHPGCGIEFQKNSGVQTHCSKHRKPPKYIPVAEREENDGSESGIETDTVE